MTPTPEQSESRRLLADALKTIEEIDAHLAAKEDAVTASSAPRGATGGMVSRMAAMSGRAQASPSAGVPSASPVAITAAVSGGNTVAGAPLESTEQLGELMADTLAKARPRADRRMREFSPLLQARWQLPRGEASSTRLTP